MEALVTWWRNITSIISFSALSFTWLVHGHRDWIHFSVMWGLLCWCAFLQTLKTHFKLHFWLRFSICYHKSNTHLNWCKLLSNNQSVEKKNHLIVDFIWISDRRSDRERWRNGLFNFGICVIYSLLNSKWHQEIKCCPRFPWNLHLIGFQRVKRALVNILTTWF